MLNVTPDSFSDGGSFMALSSALAQAERMVAEGAQVIDVGGESSRPSGRTYGQVEGVSEEEELRRVLPVVEALVARGVRVSIDTVKPGVAERTVTAGAAIINDVSCGRSDALLRVAASSGAQLVLMHNRGRGEHTAEHTRYAHVVSEVRDELMAAVERALHAGVRREQIWLDPGIGFAKTATQSAALIAGTAEFVATGLRVLVGTSRKSFIAELAPLANGDKPAPQQRIGGSVASMAIAAWLGAHAVRVHDVRELRQAIDLTLRLREVRP